MKKLISLCIIALLSTNILFAQATDDNEIKIEQTGDTLKLYIDQIGFGNKIGGDDASGGSLSVMSITGSGLEFDLDFTGNQNILFGPVVSDNSYIKLDFAGDSNEVDWNLGYIGSTVDSNINFSVSGSSNLFDLDQGYNLSAERLDADLILIGSSNIFDIDWDSDDLTWDFDVTGGSNNINTNQKDGEQSLTFTLDGDSADVDINQLSGTCVSGAGNSCSSPDANILLDIESDNAVIQINQKDAANDS